MVFKFKNIDWSCMGINIIKANKVNQKILRLEQTSSCDYIEVKDEQYKWRDLKCNKILYM